MRTHKLPSLLVLVLFSSGCAIVTTYGKDPEKLSENTYKFELHYNIYSSDKDIDKKAHQIVVELEKKNGHENCKYSRGNTRPLSGSQSVIYNVRC